MNVFKALELLATAKFADLSADDREAFAGAPADAQIAFVNDWAIVATRSEGTVEFYGVNADGEPVDFALDVR
jgi:hypothetical protein